MEGFDCTAGIGVELTYECRDIGYGIELGEGVYVYRGRDQYGKYAFEDCDGGEFIYLFPDEILEWCAVERQMFTIRVEAYRKPTTATWERFAYTERQAVREANEAGAREWPDAVEVRSVITYPERAAMA